MVAPVEASSASLGTPAAPFALAIPPVPRLSAKWTFPGLCTWDAKCFGVAQAVIFGLKPILEDGTTIVHPGMTLHPPRQSIVTKLASEGA